MDLKKKFCLRKQAIHKSTTKQKFVTNLHNREVLGKMHMQLEIRVCLGYSSTSFNV